MLPADGCGSSVWNIPRCILGGQTETDAVRYFSRTAMLTHISLRPGSDGPPHGLKRLVHQRLSFRLGQSNISSRILILCVCVYMCVCVYVFNQLQLQRRRSFYILNIILPVLFLSVTSSLTFALPSDAGEKMGLSITVLLAYAVYLTLVTDSMPDTSVQVTAVLLWLLLP